MTNYKSNTNVSNIENNNTRDAAFMMLADMDLEAALLDKEDFASGANTDLTFERISESERSPVAPEFRFFTLTEDQYNEAIDAVIADLSV